MTDTIPVVPAVVTAAHWYSWQAIKADLAEFESILGLAAKYAPEAAAVADIAEVAVGAGVLVPVTSEAVAGVEALAAADAAAHANNVTAVLQNIQSAVTAGKIIATGAVAATP